jgi:hypothetical protein
MKTSNYIFIAFLAFIALVLVGWHIDSKLYEEVYDDKRQTKMEFLVSRTNLEKDKHSPEKRKDFVVKAKIFFNQNQGYQYDYKNAADLIIENFTIFKDTTNMLLAKEWAKKACLLSPKGYSSNVTYATTLQYLGLTEEAEKYFEMAKNIELKKGYKLIEYKNEKGEKIYIRRKVD